MGKALSLTLRAVSDWLLPTPRTLNTTCPDQLLLDAMIEV